LAVGPFVLHARHLEGCGIARAVSVDDELLADLQRILRDAIADKAVGRSALDAPLLNGAVVAFDVNPDPGVRVDEFDFRDSAPQYQRFVFAEYRVPRMVRAHGRGAHGNHHSYKY